MAYDGSGRRRVQLGPRLTSGSGAPSRLAPAPPVFVRLPPGPDLVLAVAVRGVPQVAGEAYSVAAGFLVLDPAPMPERLLRRWARAARRPRRRGDGVDVWLGSADGVTVLRDLPLSPRRSSGSA